MSKATLDDILCPQAGWTKDAISAPRDLYPM